MSSPYRVHVVTVVIKPSLFERILFKLSNCFQFARRRLGGHWERRWHNGGPYTSNLPIHERDYWEPWKLMDTCTYPSEVHEDQDFGVFCDPDDTDCEDWGPFKGAT